jgi:hypothetical protein
MAPEVARRIVVLGVPARKSILSNSRAAANAGLLMDVCGPAGLCGAREFFAIAIEGRRSCREFRPFASSTTFVGWSVSVDVLALSIDDSADEGSWPSGQAARRSYR